jgi:uncharacterized protein
MIRPLVFFTALALMTLPLQAASFDCDKAESPDEIAVCGNLELSALDSEMGGLWYAYSQVPMLMGSNGARHDEAEAFLESRAACGNDVACLTDLYDARIETLESHISDQMKTFACYVTGDGVNCN